LGRSLPILEPLPPATMMTLFFTVEFIKNERGASMTRSKIQN
jgi:hypothetical protein